MLLSRKRGRFHVESGRGDIASFRQKQEHSQDHRTGKDRQYRKHPAPVQRSGNRSFRQRCSDIPREA